MSLIGKNIRKIRSVKGLSQTAFAEMFELTRASVGAYEEGRAEPKLSTIITIANSFGISLDLLVKKELTVNELYRFDIFKTELSNVVDIDDGSEGKEITIVRQQELQDYQKNIDNIAFVDSLASVVLKNALFKMDRIFQLGHSDHVVYSHPIDGIEYVFAIRRELDKLKEDEKAYFLAITEERYYFGRGKIGKTKVRLFRSGEDIEIDKKELKELWKVEKVISSLVDSNMDWTTRMDELEKRIAKLEKVTK